jgi:hypothetical protein
MDVKHQFSDPIVEVVSIKVFEWRKFISVPMQYFRWKNDSQVILKNWIIKILSFFDSVLLLDWVCIFVSLTYLLVHFSSDSLKQQMRSICECPIAKYWSTSGGCPRSVSDCLGTQTVSSAVCVLGHAIITTRQVKFAAISWLTSPHTDWC